MTPITYFLTALNTDHYYYFLINLTICILMSICGNSMALLLGSCVSDPKIAGALSPLVFLPLILCSGFYSNSNLLPWVTKWIGYINPFAYAYNGILHVEFND